MFQKSGLLVNQDWILGQKEGSEVERQACFDDDDNIVFENERRRG